MGGGSRPWNENYRAGPKEKEKCGRAYKEPPKKGKRGGRELIIVHGIKGCTKDAWIPGGEGEIDLSCGKEGRRGWGAAGGIKVEGHEGVKVVGRCQRRMRAGHG